MTRSQRTQYTILTLVGLMAIFAFASFWFQISNLADNFNGPARIFDIILFLVVTYIVWLPIFMKVLLWGVASHIQTNRTPTPQPGHKVAFVTTFVPASESIELLHHTLPAMVNANYEHDTWLLDEGDDPTVKQICKKYGVKHFSRAGKAHYNMQDGKFARKTKGGNHNSWYDSIGNDYDFVAQIDTDFIPRADFLTKTLGHFKNPKVAFVGTPQIYGNINDSLIARGAAEQTYNFYGPLLRGMDGMDSTLLIGANHVMRVAALKDVDHYSAHITEDLLTGMKLHSKGWTSVYVAEALAIGEGPTTWKGYFDQQKRWAYGCMHILFNHSFKLFRYMTFRRIAYYFCIQQHYFTGLAMFLGIVCLSLYFFGGMQSMNLDLVNFISSYIGILIIMAITDLWLQNFNIRPKVEKGAMWAGMYISIAVWPIFLMAFFALFKRRKLVYKVTPKGNKVTKKQPHPLRVFVPHIVLGLIAIAGFASSFVTHRDSPLMLFWALVSGILLLVVPVIPPLVKRISLTYRKLRPLT